MQVRIERPSRSKLGCHWNPIPEITFLSGVICDSALTHALQFTGSLTLSLHTHLKSRSSLILVKCKSLKASKLVAIVSYFRHRWFPFSLFSTFSKLQRVVLLQSTSRNQVVASLSEIKSSRLRRSRFRLHGRQLGGILVKIARVPKNRSRSCGCCYSEQRVNSS